MSAKDLLTPFDLDIYHWKPLSSDNPSEGRIRPLGGGENTQDVFNRYLKGEQTLFFGLLVGLGSPRSREELVNASRKAWVWLRYHIPLVASRIEIAEGDTPMLVYRTESAAEVATWASRTFIVDEQASGNIDLDGLRHKLGPMKVPSGDGDQAWLHLVPGVVDANGAVSQFGLLLHTHHTPYDGVGLKIIFNRYLAQLAQLLDPQEAVESPLSWGKELDNLPPAVFTILAPTEPLPVPPTSSEEPTFANPYYASLGANPHGFVPKAIPEEWPDSQRASVIFTKDESAAVMKALKHSSGVKYTLTHIAHAALAMTVLADNPPTSDAASKALYNLSLADCRDRLKEPYSSREGYPGYALGVQAMGLPVNVFLSDKGEPLPLDKNTLGKAAKALRNLYAAEKDLPARLSYMAHGAIIFGGQMKQGISASMFPLNQGYSFSSDGPGERYLNATFTDSTGTTCLTVEHFFTSLNRTDPGPFFRISSWGGIIDLSADFNAKSTPVETAKKYVTQWKEFMILASEFEDENY
ncbi:hypothetical protein BDQ12DRAFT_605022 [Crucibulum laeve]|uniref:Uncharacterized protein n=1 Tax=Crucibulum laeve TaxID=68775 RepID=A0A5C3M3A6_9AGAR|nr:hypothetical protein BDQ12DRAFT_605022 [Crucibulum laeve]